jgi:hypothetical protein
MFSSSMCSVGQKMSLDENCVTIPSACLKIVGVGRVSVLSSVWN